MMKINRTLSKAGLSLCTALLLSGGARASSIPTSSDEARALPTNVSTGATAAVKGVVTTTDEARALAGYALPISITTAAVSKTVTSTDEARALAGGEVEIVRPENRAMASTR